MIDIIQAEQILIENCKPECPCQSVHVILLDAEGEPIAAIGLTHDTARALADDILATADLAEAARARIDGRLA